MTNRSTTLAPWLVGTAEGGERHRTKPTLILADPMSPAPLPTHPEPWPGVEIPTARLWTYVRRSGRARAAPVVLLHGYAVHGGMWAQVRSTLEPEFDVIVPDLRGHGFSERSAAPFTVADLADDVAALLSALDLPRAHVVGYSLGGYVALGLALRHPDRVARLALLCTGAHQHTRRRQAELHALEALFRVAPADLMQRITERNLMGPNLPVGMDRALRWLMARNDSRSLAHGARALRNADWRRDLHGITHETLLVSAGQDLALPEPYWAPLKALRRVRHEHFTDAGHALILSHEQQLSRLLRTFLSEGP